MGQQRQRTSDRRVVAGLVVHDIHIVQRDVAGIRDCPGVSDRTARVGQHRRTGQRDRDGRGGDDLAGGRSGVRDRGGGAIRAGYAEGGGDHAGVDRNGVRADVEVGGRAGRQRGHNFHGVGHGPIADYDHVGQGAVAGVRHHDAISQQTVGHHRVGRTKRCHRNLGRGRNRTGIAAKIGDGETADARGADSQRVGHGAIGRRQVNVSGVVEEGHRAGRQRSQIVHRRVVAGLVVGHKDVGQGDVAGVADAACKKEWLAWTNPAVWTKFGHCDARRGIERARAGRRGIRHHVLRAVVAARGCHRAANRAGVGGRGEGGGKDHGLMGQQRQRTSDRRVVAGLVVHDIHIVQRDVAGIRDCPGVSDRTARVGQHRRTGQRDRDGRGGDDLADGGRSGVRGRGGCAKVLAGCAESVGDPAGVGRNGVSDVEVGGRAGRQRGHNFHGVGPGLIAEHGDVRQGEVASVRHRDAINQRTAGQYRGDRTKRRDRNLRRSQDGTGRTVSTGDGETAGARSAGNQRVSHGTIRRRRVTVGESDPHAGGQRRPCEHLRIGNRLIVDDDDVCQGHVAGVADAA